MADRFRCPACSAELPAAAELWRCPDCGGPLVLVGEPPRAVELAGAGVWRYLPWLPVRTPVSLGEPTTPLVELRWESSDLLLKLEGALPTGSFKDRGAAVLVAWLAELGADAVVEDSSGNAGAALAAYCARAGIACDLYVPADAPPAKLAQIHAFGARSVPVPGARADATSAAMRAAAEGAVYASHASSPLYLAGTRTFAFELWEQLEATAPDALVLPVGGGSLALGAHLGFRALRDAGLVERLPRLVCAQAAACAPIAEAVARGSPRPAPVDPAPTAADGIRIPEPVRGEQVLAAIAESGGTAVAVGEDELLDAHERLARRGLLVERTSAVALAALSRPGLVEAGERVVVAITGNGLKTLPA
jgi:threonine synthase